MNACTRYLTVSISLLVVNSWMGLPLLWAGDISGKVTLVGAPPPEVLVDLSNFPECRRVHPAPLYTRHYVTSAEGGLANVFVYVKKGLEGKKYPVPAMAPLLDQKNCGFNPYVMGVHTNQRFKIKNSEPYMDTVHALPILNKEFNIAQPITGMINERQFDQPEVLIKVKCEVHPWEFAFIGVVNHPFFAVTDKDGTFKFPSGLPAGQYYVEAVHPKAGTKTQVVLVAEQQAKTVNFAFEPKKAASLK